MTAEPDEEEEDADDMLERTRGARSSGGRAVTNDRRATAATEASERTEVGVEATRVRAERESRSLQQQQVVGEPKRAQNSADETRRRSARRWQARALCSLSLRTLFASSSCSPPCVAAGPRVAHDRVSKATKTARPKLLTATRTVQTSGHARLAADTRVGTQGGGLGPRVQLQQEIQPPKRKEFGRLDVFSARFLLAAQRRAIAGVPVELDPPPVFSVA